MDLVGPFGLFDREGRRIEVSSRKGMALLALVATGRNGVRSRAWLQDTLWGSREKAQAQTSLRRELSTLRKIVNISGSLLVVSQHRVALDLKQIEIDILSATSHVGDGVTVFMEGLDVAGEEAFEDWLRAQRARFVDFVPMRALEKRSEMSEHARDLRTLVSGESCQSR